MEPASVAAPASADRDLQKTARESSLSPRFVLVLAAWFGLVGGYLDLGMIFLKKDIFHASLYYEQGRHFLWTVPVANLAVMMLPGLLAAGVNWLRPGLFSLRNGVWLFATLAIWGPLLRAPLFGVASLFLSVGIARVLSGRVAGGMSGDRWFVRCSLAMLVVVVGATAVVSYGRQVLTESRALARLPTPTAGAPNVLLIVMDTVRADSLGMYGYARDTSPNLARWAQKGIRFDLAMSPAPWTFPSHCSIMTGQWPSTLNAHWQKVLDTAYPTLAEFLAARGYLTAGFAANTFWCSYESGMDRGFAHYEDYPVTARTVLGSTLPGRWILKNLASRGYYGVKWVLSQSRDARGINHAFLDWLTQERKVSRPFFAFLNYLDAHEPFLPPEDQRPHFGLRPESGGENRMLLEYWDRDKLELSKRDVELARDSYDNCIAALDRQVGALLDELEKRGILRDTLVIITSDHGEQFGEHGVFNHGFSLYGHEVHVPLLIISAFAPTGQTVSEPVSLRDLAATIVDVSGLAAGSPFPGRSLAEYWRPALGAVPPHAAVAVSEVDIPLVIIPQRGRGPSQRGFTISLVAEGLHYLLDVRGTEELYDLAADPRELRDLKSSPGQKPALGRFRSALRQILVENRVTSAAARQYQEQLKKVLKAMNRQPPI